jgi:hypothetical protein
MSKKKKNGSVSDAFENTLLENVCVGNDIVYYLFLIPDVILMLVYRMQIRTICSY